MEMKNGERKFNELLQTLEQDGVQGTVDLVKAKGGFKKAYRKARMETPEEGGVLAYFDGFKYPMKGRPMTKTVNAMGAIKRLILMGMNYGYKYMRKHRTDPRLYCTAVREIYRCWNIAIERERDPNMKDKWTKMRDLLCMFLENDLAYRYRFQDIIAEVDIEKLKLDEADSYYCRMPARNKSYNFGDKFPPEVWEKKVEEKRKQVESRKK